MLKRRDFLKGCSSLGLLAAVGLCRTGFADVTGRPNVIVMLSDDQGWGDFSHHGNKDLNTPNTDALAVNGAEFENFYVCAVCSPTRAELLTGRYHARSGISSTSSGGERLNLDETTFADLFKRAGYATAAYGKWHNGMQYPYHPNGRGFDDFYGFCSGHWGNYFEPMLEHNGKVVKGKGFLVDDITGWGVDFIEKNKDKPFLLYLPFNTPHTPMQVPDEFWNRFAGRQLEMSQSNDFTRAALAMCENIDWNVGRITKKLKECGLERNTIVMFMNDNGPNNNRWNGGMRGRKGSTDEGGVRSPLFVSWPGTIPNGKKIKEISGAIDILPTLVELCRLDGETNNEIDGRSLAPLLLGEETAWEQRYIFNNWRGALSVRSQDHRLDREGRLYDMRSDRGQQNDIAQKEPDIAKGLQAAAFNFRKEVLAHAPRTDRRPFTLGHPDARYTHMPARDARHHGNIQRSNRWPNSSFLMNWTDADDRITWNVEVPADGEFEVTIYYTCPEGDEGSKVQLSVGESKLETTIDKPHDPPLRGMEHDRVRRQESYVKDFRPLPSGRIELKQGLHEMELRALEVANKTVMDFRMMVFERIS